MKPQQMQIKTWRVILASIIDAVLIIISIPIVLTFSGLSVMVFDAPESASRWQPWLLFWGVNGGSALLLLAAVIGSVWMLRAKKLWLSLCFAALPLVFLGVFFVIINLSRVG